LGFSLYKGYKNKKAPPEGGTFFIYYKKVELQTTKAGVDGVEDVTDHGSEDHERSDNNDSNQNKNQRIFNQTLAFFFG